MRIECPKCHASGTINDHEIPDEGRFLACPRCKENFQIVKPRKKVTSAFATNTCPSCGYSTFCEEVFDDCPHCGMAVREIIERKRKEDAQKREHKNHVADVILPVVPPIGSRLKVPAAVDEKEKASIANFANGFEPVAAIGWGAAVFAAIILVMGGLGLVHYLGTDIQTTLSEQSVEQVSAWHVFWGYGFLPWLETLLGVILMTASLGFLQRATWGLQAMQRAVTVSLILVPGYELTQYVVWIVKSIAPPWWAYLVECMSAVIVSTLFMVPLFFLLRYLSGDSFKRVYLKS